MPSLALAAAETNCSASARLQYAPSVPPAFLRKGAVRRAPCAEASDASEASRVLEVDQMDQWIPLVAGFRVPKKRKGDEKLPGKAPESGKMNAYQHRAENRSRPHRPHRPHRSYRWPRSCSWLTKQGLSGFFLRPLVQKKLTGCYIPVRRSVVFFCQVFSFFIMV